MNLLQLYSATKQYGAKILFDKAGFSINQGEHVGVIGPNGAGKTTLFKIITGKESLDSGEITKTQGLRIGYLEQETDWDNEMTVESVLVENNIVPIWNLKKMGLSLGLKEDIYVRPLKELSGGYRMRVKLLQLLGQEPDLLLLDEPTNFLDLESIIALEKFLVDYKYAFLLISHDREFLRRTTENTLEVEGGDITKFPGHIDDYFEQKAELLKTLMAQAMNLEKKREHLQSFVDRFRAKATKAKQAQSRMKQLDKMENIEIKAIPLRARISIPEPFSTGKEILQITNAELGYKTDVEIKSILRQVNLRIEKGQKIGIVGFNGVGKSTLLKSIGQRISLIQGELKLGYNVSLSYFAQHLADELINTDSVLDSLQRKAHKDNTHQQILNMAGSLLFSGDDVYKKINVLSGGEKTRVALGQILLQKNPLLLLDEPTNHLDFDTVNALAEALKDYQGTLLVVSHDRSFIKRVSSQILEIRNGFVELYPGSYDDYLWSLEKGALKERDSALDTASTTSLQNNKFDEKKFNYKEETKKLTSEIKEYERKILKTEEILFSLNKKINEINSELMTAQGLQAQSLAKESATTSQKISESEEILLAHMENLELTQQRLASLKN